MRLAIHNFVIFIFPRCCDNISHTNWCRLATIQTLSWDRNFHCDAMSFTLEFQWNPNHFGINLSLRSNSLNAFLLLCINKLNMWIERNVRMYRYQLITNRILAFPCHLSCDTRWTFIPIQCTGISREMLKCAMRILHYKSFQSNNFCLQFCCIGILHNGFICCVFFFHIINRRKYGFEMQTTLLSLL